MGRAPDTHRFAQVSRIASVAGAGLLATAGARSRRAAVAGGILACAGALAARWSVYGAGFASAADSTYVVAPQRAAIDSGRRPGAARTSVRVPAAADGSPAAPSGSLVS